MDGCIIRNKPPIGLVPKYIHDYNRVRDIKEAIKRYQEFGSPVPTEWLVEYYELTKGMIT